MEVIRHHRKPDDIDTKDPRPKFQRSSLPRSQTASSLSLGVAHLLPLPPMLVALPGEFIDAAQKPTPHAPIHTVHNLNLPIRQHLTPIHSRYDSSPVRYCCLTAGNESKKTTGSQNSLGGPSGFPSPELTFRSTPGGLQASI